MRLKLFTIFSVLCFQFGFSQEIYLKTGKNFTSYDYKDSTGKTNSDIKSSSGSTYELGYEYGINDRVFYSGSLTWNQYNAKGANRVNRYEWNTNYFKVGIRKAGLDFIDGDSAIVPVMLYDAKLSQEMAGELLKFGIYVIGFFYPVVAKGQARIRTQISAAHTKADLDKAINAFVKVGKKLNVIK